MVFEFGGGTQFIVSKKNLTKPKEILFNLLNVLNVVKKNKDS